MKLRLLALPMLALPLCSCVGLGSRSEGVFEPTAVQPPSFERGSTSERGGTARPDRAAEAPAPRALSVPAR